MAKNVTTNVDVKLNEELYDQIVNGFGGQHGSTITKAKFSNVQLQRIKAVGKIWGKNHNNYSFFDEVLNLIKPKTNKKIFGNVIIDQVEEDDDFEDEIGDEKELTSSDDGIWTLLQTLNNFYSWWNKYKKIRRVIEITSDVIEFYKNTTMAEKLLTKAKVSIILEQTMFKMFDDALAPIVEASSKGAINLYNSPKVQHIFTLLKEKQEAIKRHVAVQTATTAISLIGGPVGVVASAIGALENIYYQATSVGSGWKTLAAVGTGLIDVASSAVPGGRAATSANKILKIANYTSKAAMLGVNIAEVTIMINNMLNYTEKDEAQVREWIDTELTKPSFVPLANTIISGVYEMKRSFDDGLAERVSLMVDVQRGRIGQSNGESIRRQVQSVMEQRERDREEALRREQTYGSEISMPDYGRFANFNITWNESSTKSRVRRSFTNRINVNVSGNIPQMNTKESLTMRALTATIVAAQRGQEEIWRKLTATDQILYNIETYKGYVGTVTGIDRQVYFHNENGLQPRIEAYNLDESHSRIMYGDIYTDSSGQAHNFQSVLYEDKGIRQTYSGNMYLYRTWDSKLSEIERIHRNTQWELVSPENKAAIEEIRKYCERVKAANQGLINDRLGQLRNDWKIELRASNDKQQVIPIFEMNGAVKGVWIKYKILKIRNGVEEYLFDGVNAGGILINHTDLPKQKQMLGLNNSFVSFNLGREYVTIHTYTKENYATYYQTVDLIQGGKNSNSILELDGIELEKENSINETTKLLLKALLGY